MVSRIKARTNAQHSFKMMRENPFKGLSYQQIKHCAGMSSTAVSEVKKAACKLRSSQGSYGHKSACLNAPEETHEQDDRIRLRMWQSSGDWVSFQILNIMHSLPVKQDYAPQKNVRG